MFLVPSLHTPEHEAAWMLPEAEAFTFLWPGLSLKLHYFIIVIRLRPGLRVQCSLARRVILSSLQAPGD